MQAVVQVGNSQYLLTPGQRFSIDGHISTPQASLALDNVLLVIGDSQTAVGKPDLKFIVNTRVLRHYQGDKVVAATFKAKSRYRKTKGFRAKRTELEVLDIREK